MNATDLPLVDHVVSFGPDSRIFDALLLSGPFIVALIVLLGRTTVTSGLAIGYLVLFVTGVAYEAVEAHR